MILFDMDGTLAQFYGKSDCLERMFDKNFFLNLKPYNLIKTVNRLIANGYRVGILSACVDSPYCKNEKLAWISKWLPNINFNNVCLCNIGQNKAQVAADFFKLRQNEPLILIDDYSENIYNWEMANTQSLPYIAIKFINEINNKSGKEYKYKFSKNSQLVKILKQLNVID